MNKISYIIILISMLFIDFELFFVGGTIVEGFGEYVFILVAIYETLIIFEIKNNKVSK